MKNRNNLTLFAKICIDIGVLLGLLAFWQAVYWGGWVFFSFIVWNYDIDWDIFLVLTRVVYAFTFMFWLVSTVADHTGHELPTIELDYD